MDDIKALDTLQQTKEATQGCIKLLLTDFLSIFPSIFSILYSCPTYTQLTINVPFKLNNTKSLLSLHILTLFFITLSENVEFFEASLT